MLANLLAQLSQFRRDRFPIVIAQLDFLGLVAFLGRIARITPIFSGIVSGVSGLAESVADKRNFPN